MITALKHWFGSIIFKLFICFWLIAILSVVITRLISTQFSDDSVILPAHKDDLRRLHFITRAVDKKPPRSTEAFLLRLQKRMNHGPNRPATIWLKEVESQNLYSLGLNKHKSLAQYLKKNTFSDVVSIQFPYARITGPLNITLAKTDYQLYITSKEKNPHIGLLIMQMPAWARIATPIIISLLICWLLARSLTKPLLRIKRSATQLGDGNLSVRVQKVTNRKDELGQLATSFNQMAEKLEQSVSAQQRLLGDISHELRSPMTRLQMALGLAQQNPLTTVELNKYLQRCELEVERLDTMIGDTLALSRLENSLQPLNINKINIVSLLTLLIEDAQFLANEKSVSIKITSQGSYSIMADSQLLSGALSNILTNAVKYSPASSIVLVNISSSGSDLIITITDEGIGVPVQNLKQLFEPFYRVVEARDRQTGGTGLGLAIAKQAILAHHGEISAKNHPNKGLTVMISLPWEAQES